MAANAKSKRKYKGKTLDLNTFLGEDKDAAPGFAVVQRKLDWADTMDNEDLDDRYTLDFKKEEKVVLPTAPKAARGPDVDVTKIPSSPPFTLFLGNLPYDVSEEDIVFFFRKVPVKNVRLPRENGDRGRIRGFGYAEFESKQDLIQALNLNSETLKNRAIKISLAGEHDGDRDRRDGGPDRTMGDWRAEKKDQFSRDDSRSDGFSSRGGGFGDRDRDSYRSKSNYDRPFERNNDRPFERNNDRPFERNNDRPFERNNDRPFERNNDRFGDRNGDRFERNDYGGGRSDRDFGGGRDQDRFERRGNDRGYGFSSDRGMSRGGGGGGRSNDRRDDRGFMRRDDRAGDSRYRDSADRDLPPRESYNDRRPPAERPSAADGGGTKERRKLQLAPRTKPIESAEAATASSIFGGAKPVDTAAREREIEERLAREKETVAPKDSKDARDSADIRIRKFSSSSGVSNRSRRSSDSGPLRDDEDHIPPYKPPIPRQQEQESQPYNTLPRTRQRCGSNSSTGSDRENMMNSKANAPPPPPHDRKENYNNNYNARSENYDDDSYSDPSKGGFRNVRHNHSHRDNSRERALHATYEEPRPPVYTSANKFSQLNDSEDLDRGSTSE